MEDRPETQLDLWHLLGSTALLLAEGLRPEEKGKSGRGSGSTLDLGQFPRREQEAGTVTPRRETRAAKLTIRKARFGPGSVIVRRD